jgi:hypothetical protein
MNSWRPAILAVALVNGIRLSVVDSAWHWLGWAMVAAFVAIVYVDMERASRPTSPRRS